MEQAVAETIAHATREEAAGQAREDLNELRRRAVEAGRERSRKLIKVSTINATTGAIRYNPAGRVLRDWYLHVYINTLRTRLGQPSEAIGAQQIEDTAKLLHRLRPEHHPHRAVQAVGVARNMAVADAADAVVHISDRVREIGTERAIRLATDDRFDGDQLRVHVARHWYKRCHEDVVDRSLDVQHPLAAVTAAEELQVSRTLATRETRRLVGRDGIPLVNANSRLVTELDRRLAAGEVDLVPVTAMSNKQGETFTSALAKCVEATWRVADPTDRADWLHAAGALPAPPDAGWTHLHETQQVRLLQHYLTAHRTELVGYSFGRSIIRGEDGVVARKMFNHRSELNSDHVPAGLEEKARTSFGERSDPQVATRSTGRLER